MNCDDESIYTIIIITSLIIIVGFNKIDKYDIFYWCVDKTHEHTPWGKISKHTHTPTHVHIDCPIFSFISVEILQPSPDPYPTAYHHQCMPSPKPALSPKWKIAITKLEMPKHTWTHSTANYFMSITSRLSHAPNGAAENSQTSLNIYVWAKNPYTPAPRRITPTLYCPTSCAWLVSGDVDKWINHFKALLEIPVNNNTRSRWKTAQVERALKHG